MQIVLPQTSTPLRWQLPAGMPMPARQHVGDDAAAAGARVQTARPRLLVVEDDWLIVAQIEQFLSAAGFEIVGTAADAATAAAIAGRERPDLVLMDIRIQGSVDGVDAACEIVDRFGIRCIFVSAHSDAGTMARTLAAQPLGWLPKPFTEAELVHAVRAALGPASPSHG